MSSPPHKKRRITEGLSTSNNESPATPQKDGPMNSSESDVPVDIESTDASSKPSIELDPSLLIDAAISGDISRVRELLAAGAPVDAQDQDGISALVMASICGHEEVMWALQDAGANADSIHLNLSVVKTYLPRSVGPLDAHTHFCPKIHEGNHSTRSSLLWRAATDGNKSLTKALLLSGVNVDSEVGLDALSAAVYSGHMDIVKMLLDARAPVNAYRSNKHSPLHIAAEVGRMDLLNILLDAGAIQNHPSSAEDPAFMVALKNGYTDIARLLLSRFRSYANQPDRRGVMPLLWAVEDLQVDVARELIDAGAKVYPDNPVALNQFDLLRIATRHNSIELTRILLAAKANPDLHPKNGIPVLIFASSEAKMDILKELLKAQADTEIKDANGLTAMAHAVKRGHIEVVKLLAAAGADVNVQVDKCDRGSDEKDDWRRPYWAATAPLLLALKRDDVAAMNSLIKAGAHLNVRNDQGDTALMRAVCDGKMEFVQALVAAKAGLEVRDANGSTVLLLAVECNQPNVLKVLIDAGANLDARDHLNRTALSLASSPKVAAALIAARADVSARDNYGRTPLIAAVQRRKVEIVRSLLKAGANVNDEDFAGVSVLLASLSRDHNDVPVNEDIVKALLDAKALVGGMNSNGGEVLILAVATCTKSIVEMVLKAGAAINGQSHHGNTALMSAVGIGSPAVASLLIAHRANVNLRNDAGETALIKAARKGNICSVKMLLDAGARWETQHLAEIEAFMSVCEGATRVQTAVPSDFDCDDEDEEEDEDEDHEEDGNEDHDEENEKDEEEDAEEEKETEADRDPAQLIELLIAAKDDVDPIPLHFGAPLMVAAKRPDIVRVLLKAGAPVDTRGKNGETALIAATKADAHDSVELLLQAKADPNAIDFQNATALKYALMKGNVNTAKALVDAGAQAEMGYSAQQSPLAQVLPHASPDMVRVLLDGKADVHKLRYHVRLLEEAVNRDRVTVFQHLVGAGLDLSELKTTIASRMLNTAVSRNYRAVLRCLIDAKIPIDAVNPYGTSATPLMRAIDHCGSDLGLVKMLLDAGARVDACVSYYGDPVLWSDSVHQNPRLLKTLLCAFCYQIGYLEPLANVQNVSDDLFGGNADEDAFDEDWEDFAEFSGSDTEASDNP